jgi:hypothetical protein
MNIMRIKVDNIYIFWSSTSRLNITYFVIKYKKNKIKKKIL